MEIISVINQKGGVGKSTTAEALIAGLTLKGYKTLGIDLDTQSNLSYTFRVKTNGSTALGILTGEAKAEDAIQHTPEGDIIPASKHLASADLQLTEIGKEYRLKEALESVKGQYDYIIIDTPPALGILTTNALTASTKVIIPSQADIYSLQGINQLADTIQMVKTYCNRELKIEGILLTRFNSRAVFNKAIAELETKLAENLETKLFKSTIRESVTIREAQYKQQSIFTYAPRAKVTEDYRAFIDELTQL